MAPWCCTLPITQFTPPLLTLTHHAFYPCTFLPPARSPAPVPCLPSYYLPLLADHLTPLPHSWPSRPSPCPSSYPHLLAYLAPHASGPLSTHFLCPSSIPALTPLLLPHSVLLPTWNPDPHPSSTQPPPPPSLAAYQAVMDGQLLLEQCQLLLQVLDDSLPGKHSWWGKGQRGHPASPTSSPHSPPCAGTSPWCVISASGQFLPYW